MTREANAAIDICDVRKRFGDLRALDEVSFRVGEGEYFGLLGPNGAGKSTLINITAGLVRADAGRVRVMGHDVVGEYRQARSALGVVPQELVYDPFFTVLELLELQSGYFGFGRENRAWIDELLETLDLSGKSDQNMHSLSGGMKRRVLIAQALVHRPRVVVLDEPTAGVDVELRQALWHFTRRLHAEGHTIVLTTHYLEEAEALCERIAILREGRLAALDTKQALLSRHPFRMLHLRWRGGPLPEALRSLAVKEEADRADLRLKQEDQAIAQVLSAMAAAGLYIEDLKTREPGLEEVFLELTSKGATR